MLSRRRAEGLRSSKSPSSTPIVRSPHTPTIATFQARLGANKRVNYSRNCGAESRNVRISLRSPIYIFDPVYKTKSPRDVRLTLICLILELRSVALQITLVCRKPGSFTLVVMASLGLEQSQLLYLSSLVEAVRPKVGFPRNCRQGTSSSCPSRARIGPSMS